MFTNKKQTPQNSNFPKRIAKNKLILTLLLLMLAQKVELLDWLPCTPDSPSHTPLPKGYILECATFAQPVYHSPKSNGTISIFVRRLVHSQQPGTTNIWFLDGGPGTDPGTIEAVIVPKYANLMADMRATLYVPHHRGCGKSTPIPFHHGGNGLIETVKDLRVLMQNSPIPLDAVTTADAAMDVVNLIKEVNRDGDTNYLHGFSYGSYWALHIASRSSLITGVTLDGSVPPNHHMHADRKDHLINEALIHSCETDPDGWCQRFTNRTIIENGIEEMVSFNRNNVCLTRFVEMYPKGLTMDAGLLQETIRLLINAEACFVKNRKDSKSLLMDTKVLAVQLLTHFENCVDMKIFIRLSTVVHVLLRRMNDVNFHAGVIAMPFLLEIDLDEIAPLNSKLTKKAIPLQATSNFFFTDSDEEIETPPNHPHALSTSDSKETLSPLINHAVFAQIVFTEFWSHDGDPVDNGNVWSKMTPNGIPYLKTLRKTYSEAIPKNTTTSPSYLDLSTIKVPVLILSGDLDSRTPLHVAQSLYSQLRTTKKMLTFTNQGHIISSLMEHSPSHVNACLSPYLLSFYSTGIFPPTPKCMQHNNTKSRLDWQHDRIVDFSYSFWPLTQCTYALTAWIWIRRACLLHPRKSIFGLISICGVIVLTFALMGWRRRMRKELLASATRTNTATKVLV